MIYKKYNALTIANEIIEIHNHKLRRDINAQRLLKLLYICQGVKLSESRTALFSDDIRSTVFGPYVRSVYKKIKKFRLRPIEKPLRTFYYKKYDNSKIDIENLALIFFVCNVTKSLTSMELSTLCATGALGKPWQMYTDNGRENVNVTLPNDVIEQYFVRNLQQVII